MQEGFGEAIRWVDDIRKKPEEERYAWDRYSLFFCVKWKRIKGNYRGIPFQGHSLFTTSREPQAWLLSPSLYVLVVTTHSLESADSGAT